MTSCKLELYNQAVIRGLSLSINTYEDDAGRHSLEDLVFCLHKNYRVMGDHFIEFRQVGGNTAQPLKCNSRAALFSS